MKESLTIFTRYDCQLLPTQTPGLCVSTTTKKNHVHVCLKPLSLLFHLDKQRTPDNLPARLPGRYRANARCVSDSVSAVRWLHKVAAVLYLPVGIQTLQTMYTHTHPASQLRHRYPQQIRCSIKASHKSIMLSARLPERPHRPVRQGRCHALGRTPLVRLTKEPWCKQS